MAAEQSTDGYMMLNRKLPILSNPAIPLSLPRIILIPEPEFPTYKRPSSFAENWAAGSNHDIHETSK
jgi:hypothetical protein